MWETCKSCELLIRLCHVLRQTAVPSSEVRNYALYWGKKLCRVMRRNAMLRWPHRTRNPVTKASRGAPTLQRPLASTVHLYWRWKSNQTINTERQLWGDFQIKMVRCIYLNQKVGPVNICKSRSWPCASTQIKIFARGICENQEVGTGINSNQGVTLDIIKSVHAIAHWLIMS